MTRASFFFRLGVFLVAIAIGYPLLFKGPLGTPLPGSPQELPKLRKALDQLTPEERGLVERYVARSKGTVLPPMFADPEDPLTARTFGEAIKLQRELEARHAKNQAVLDAQRKLREEQLAPLREALSVELQSREIIGPEEFLHRGLPSSEATKPPADTERALIVTYRVRNNSAEPIERFSIWVTVRTIDDPSSSRGISSCTLEEVRVLEPLEPGAQSDIHCGDLYTRATAADEQFAALPQHALMLTYEPREIRFASGRKMTGP
jgi:hypothetical protein